MVAVSVERVAVLLLAELLVVVLEPVVVVVQVPHITVHRSSTNLRTSSSAGLTQSAAANTSPQACDSGTPPHSPGVCRVVAVAVVVVVVQSWLFPNSDPHWPQVTGQYSAVSAGVALQYPAFNPYGGGRG